MQFFGSITELEAQNLNMLALAFVGDAVQSLYARELFAKGSDAKAGKLHRQTIGEVCSRSQATQADALHEMLTDTERDIFRRARNAKNNTAAKNSTLTEYKKATALEAVFGYLYLTGQTERLKTLLDKAHDAHHE